MRIAQGLRCELGSTEIEIRADELWVFAHSFSQFGSVGTMCGIALFMAADNDPLFLQIKEARASVLEPFAGKSPYPNHGRRVILGQRLMQTASDVSLGWTVGIGRHFYIRQLRAGKISAVIEDWDARLLRAYGRMCAHALARVRTHDPAMRR